MSKFNLKLAICISLFSFANYVTQPLYSALVPVLLSDRLGSAAQVGVILSFCNFLAMLIHPVIGSISDRTRSRFGRRRPYILTGAVSCGLCFALIPWLNTFWQLTAALVCYSLTVAYWRAPISAILIDCVKPEHVVRTNAVASCVLALSSVFAYLSNNYLATAGMDERLVFLVGGAAAVVTALIGCLTVHEQDSRRMEFPQKKKGSGIVDAVLELTPRRRLCLAFLVAMVVFAFMANTGFEYFFVLFAIEHGKMTAGHATLYLASYMGAYFISSLICSCIRRPVSAEKMMLSILFVTAFAQLLFFGICFHMPEQIRGFLWMLCLVHGACWGMQNVYTFPLWLSFHEAGHSGNLMGLYFVCTGLAATVTPALYGVIHDLTGSYVTLFLFCGVLFLLALCMLNVSRRLQK